VNGEEVFMTMTRTTGRRVVGFALEIALFQADLFTAFLTALPGDDQMEALRRTIRGLEEEGVIPPIGDPPIHGSLEQRRAYVAAFEKAFCGLRPLDHIFRGHRVMLRVRREWRRGESA
jgi:hypothetical protein